MKNLHAIPTDKPSRLILQINDKLRLSTIVFRGQVASGVTQHVYITNDEEIKIGDWYLNGVIPTNERINKSRGTNVASFYKSKDVKKIILTTDQDLINDGVQSIDDEFLEWFVKNPSCESVEVDDYKRGGREVLSYIIIIPKEEPKQELPIVNGSYGCTIQTKIQETLEEFIDKVDTPTDFDQFTFDEGIRVGAKWQQEQVIQLLKDNDYENEAVFDFLTEEFFNQNKK